MSLLKKLIRKDERTVISKILRYAGLAILSLLLLTLVWGVFVEPYRLDREEHEVTIPHLPAEWEGQRVGLLADFQYGMWMANTATIERAVAQLIDEKPAAVLIAGDFVYHLQGNWREDINTVVDFVRPLPAAGIPTYAVLGNHDYGMPTPQDEMATEQVETLLDTLEEAGIRVLRNEAVNLSPDADTPVYLVGIDSHIAGLDQPTVALADLPADAARIVLMHNPNSYEEIPADAAPLAMAGHTHGGQVRIPFTPEWTWMTYQRDNEVHADGWIEASYGAPGNRLYVNRGIGFSVIPARLNCPPEVTYFTLRAAETTATTDRSIAQFN